MILFYFIPDKVMLIETLDDIYEAKKSNRLGLLFSMQTGTPVGRDLELWAIFHTMGLRQVQLTYNERTVFGDGCYLPG